MGKSRNNRPAKGSGRNQARGGGQQQPNPQPAASAPLASGQGTPPASGQGTAPASGQGTAPAALQGRPSDLPQQNGKEQTKQPTDLDQKRLCYALQRTTPDVKAEYATAVKALPATILMAGLGQAIAMECTKDEPRQALADDVSRWLMEQAPGRPSSVPGKTDKDPRFTLLQWLTTCTQHDYVWAQAEAMALLAWLKRCAVARTKPEPGGNG